MYWTHDPLFRFDQIVLYKSPEQQIRSIVKQKTKLGASIDEVASSDFLGPALRSWSQNYMGLMKVVRPKGRRVFINWESLVADPDRHLRRLGELLDLPYQPGVLDHIHLGHFVGGNQGVDVKAISQTGRVTLRPSNAPALPEPMRQAVLADHEAGFVHRLLDNEYRRSYG